MIICFIFQAGAGDTIDPTIVALEKRQESILSRLEQLKAIVDKLAQSETATAAVVSEGGGAWDRNAAPCSEKILACTFVARNDINKCFCMIAERTLWLHDSIICAHLY